MSCPLFHKKASSTAGGVLCKRGITTGFQEFPRFSKPQGQFLEQMLYSTSGMDH